MNILKEKIAKAISNHVSLEDTYTYELKRVKSAFEVGTMSLEDFEEWTEENVEDLAETIVDALQPQLNENQQIVFEWLKREHFDSYIKSVISNLYFYVNMTAIGDLENKEIQEMVNAYEKLSQEDFAQVLQVFSQRALEQEEER